MSNRPHMVRPYISDARIGDGYRIAFVLKERDETALLYLPSELATVTVPAATLAKASPVTYRPRVVRTNMLKRAKLSRRHGHRFPRKATVQVLQMLGAGRATIEETVSAEPLPEVVAARAQRATQAERAAELADAVAAIKARIDWQLAEEPKTRSRPVARLRKPRARYVHPDQLTLGV